PCNRDLGREIRGNIVLIGERTDRDQHNTVNGKMPGYELQANYIEALLDDRYFTPVNSGLELALAVAGILAIILIFEICDELEAIPTWLRPIVGLICSVTFLVVLFIVCSSWRIFFGQQLDFWAPLLPVPFVETIYSFRVRARPRD
ncbi:MAG: CHASE2 domain-containing protein, partial [Candidatus Sulfotelmatobacter sp.]